MIHKHVLCKRFIVSKVIVIMTHLPNYGNDRLALYTFENLFKFVKCWTNLNMRTVEPLKLAEYYFKSFPDEVDPMWKVDQKSACFILYFSTITCISYFDEGFSTEITF